MGSILSLLVGGNHCELVQALELVYPEPAEHLTLRNLQGIFSSLKFCFL